MTAPNRNALWAEVLVEELAAAGVEAACVAPGSRSTPLVVALDAHPDVRIYSILDERSAAYFALGRGRVGEPTAVVTTSGTATANLHPAVIEADRSRVPLLVVTADRPPELQDSGANQTVDQSKLYGDAVRWYRQLAEPAADARKLRSLRTTAARAVAEATGIPAGPVHLNVPFRKPLEPVEVAGDVPPDLDADDPRGAGGRDGPYVMTTPGIPTPTDADVAAIAGALSEAERPLVVAGPADPPGDGPIALASLAERLGAPLLADPLSGLRFGAHVTNAPVVGAYDAALDGGVARDRDAPIDGDAPIGGGVPPEPDVVFRVGASPTSKSLRRYLRDADARQFLVDPAGGWREAEFVATDLVVADPDRLTESLAERVDGGANVAWREQFDGLEARHWDLVEASSEELFEGGLLADVVRLAPDPSTVVVSNSMPVRDLDRFGQPRDADLRVLANRGASGIDGVTSTALGAGSATDDPLVLVTGDLAYYHDMNGLLSLSRCDVDATIVLVNNDGGGIFHKLPIEQFDPPFTEQFETPHGLDFEPTGDLYDLPYERVATRADFRSAFADAAPREDTRVIEVRTDAATSHEIRDRLAEDLAASTG